MSGTEEKHSQKEEKVFGEEEGRKSKAVRRSRESKRKKAEAEVFGGE